jgi:predicted transcriptional regulator
MDKKYQVFISSTYKDLIEQRNEVVKVVLRLSHLPVGMEIFNAASATPWDVITSHIDNSDYYVLILAHRYGSEDPVTAIGYTEKEYDYAISKGIPCLAFVIKDGVQWNTDMMEEKATQKKKLAAFKKKIHVHHVSYWTSTEDLASQVLLALVDETRNKPGIGWVRANAVTTNPAVAEELSRLSKENSELKDKLAIVANQATDIATELTDFLPANSFIIEANFNNSKVKVKYTYQELFDAISSSQADPVSYNIINSLSSEYKFPNGLYYAATDSGHYSHVLGELVSLGIVAVSISSGNDYWRLTDLGKKMYTRSKLLGIQNSSGLP